MGLNCDNYCDFEELANNLDYSSFNPFLDLIVLESISMAI